MGARLNQTAQRPGRTARVAPARSARRDPGP